MSQETTSMFSRRQALALAGPALAAFWPARGLAQDQQLPLRTTGLEHIGVTVPDPEATAKFFGRIFDPQLFQEKDPPPRFYVKLGTGYLAVGGSASESPRIDHICALVQDYKAQEMRKSLEAAGVQMAGQMASDPDGLRLQLLGVPGGLARTIVPNARISQEEAAIQAIRLDHITLAVSDLERSAAFYRKFFGAEVSRTKNPARVWFGASRTKLGLEAAAAGRKPAVDHICVRVAGFDRKAATEKLKKLGAEIALSNDEQLLRFRDLNGIMIELKSAA
jgi:catechol 2,3-dioxygenase-like lactoylglutathione lyase family enzyme